MNKDLQGAIEKGDLILFLGAGASKGCTTSKGPVLDGSGLAKFLADIGGYSYDDEPLDEVYSAVRAKLGARLDSSLEDIFRNATPSSEYSDLASFAWRRIYTLNIDDALETALRLTRVQKLHIHLSAQAVIDQDSFFDRLDYVKLNGTIDRLDEGIIFSSSDYAKATTRSLPWYEQCGSDFIRSPILFIGTKLNEPLLKFHIERYKSTTGKAPGRSYVITPSASDFQKASLSEYNIEHIPGTLSDFTKWLKMEFPKPLKPLDLAIASIPQLAEIISSKDTNRYASLFDHIFPVKRTTIPPQGQTTIGAAIHDFYKGFRPSWIDIANEIPAALDVLSKTKESLTAGFKANSITPLIGPAGSGKTTLLMQLCYEISNTPEWEVFYINQPIDELQATLEAIEKSSKAPRVLIGIDNVDFFSDQLRDVFFSRRLQKSMLIGAERENIWKRKTSVKLDQFFNSPIIVDQFSKADAEKILSKLEIYGSWTRLGQMTPKQRTAELIGRAQMQLLIALLESTFGLGFGQIIANEFSGLTKEDEIVTFMVVGLITDRKFEAPASLVDRALSAAGIHSGTTIISENLAGIVVNRDNKLSVRHPVYIRYVLDHLVDPTLTIKAIAALLEAFSQYKTPVIKHVDKLHASIYKGLINHAFLRDVLKGRRNLVLPLYKSLEKKFEQDGLFWLQYGLSLRDFHDQDESLEKLRIARQAYPMDHTLHALAQQLLIVAEHTSDKQTALTYAEESKTILKELDSILQSDDTFPLVTLSEGYTKVMRRHAGEAIARQHAREFSESLKSRSETLPNDSRLREAYERMFRYTVTGTWTEAESA
ncbi:SIR2 family protein [Pseudomonas sp. MWU12-2345]|uniref:P-loop NTPase n=1 Tax=Pseudomonas sp. MWU12-2345 TaxID=2928689 RepID=UPI0020101456|nr:SIR2 family protein [Pseudomonas sp. MWU12-2345]